MTIERLEPRRLMDAGDLDPAFGDGGSITYIAGADLRTGMPDVDVGPNNEIVMTALVTEAPDTPGRGAFISVWRAYASGQPDFQFHRGVTGSGQLLIPLPDDVVTDNGFFLPREAHGAVGPDGSIFVSVGYRLFKIRADGKLDRAFAHRGRAAFTDFEAIRDMSVDVDSAGRIYVLGTQGKFVESRNIKLLRLNPDGSLDRTFASGGAFVPAFEMPFSTSKVKVLRDGRIMIAGNGNHDRIAIRLRDDGSFDPTYGAGGVADVLVESYDLDFTSVYVRNITDDGLAIFDIGHNTDTIDFDELVAFDSGGADLGNFVSDHPAEVAGAEFRRDDALTVAWGPMGPRFFDADGQLLSTPTTHAAEQLDLNTDNEGIYTIELARDGSMLVVTSIPGDLQTGEMGNGFKIRRMFRDDAPVAQYIPRFDSSTLDTHAARIDVRWLDDDGIDITTLGDDDLTIGRPGGGRLHARLIGVGAGAGGMFTRYAVIAPGGTWDESENGIYTIRVERRSVRDGDGNAAAQRVIGSFVVQV